MIAKKSEYISLREAAEISGYSPDYVGQLIRSGKLPGKQVFSNVAWVTTEEAVRAYMGKKRGSKSAVADVPVTYERLQSMMESPKLVKVLSISLIAVCAAFMLLLFYVFSTAIDQRLNKQAAEDAARLAEQL